MVNGEVFWSRIVVDPDNYLLAHYFDDHYFFIAGERGPKILEESDEIFIYVTLNQTDKSVER